MLIKSKNALLFTYGVTNAGKTHTVIGSKSQPGILRNALSWFISFRNKMLGREDVGKS